MTVIDMYVSVIIPTFNEEKVIGECLTSLEKQSLTNFEVIVVDDGSTDSTLEILFSLQIKNYKLKIQEQSHNGPGEARNLGVKHAKGKILVFVDADMVFNEDFLERLVKPIVDGKSKGTFSKEEYVNNWDNVWARCWNINQGIKGKKRLPDDYPDTQKVFRAILKSEFDRVGGFSGGGHYTDDYLSEKLGYEADVARGAIFYHKNPDSLSEVFIQSKWAAKREYKFGILGALYSLLRSSLPVSFVFGLVKSISNYQPLFLPFKVVYDIGTTLGILEYTVLKKGVK